MSTILVTSPAGWWVLGIGGVLLLGVVVFAIREVINLNKDLERFRESVRIMGYVQLSYKYLREASDKTKPAKEQWEAYAKAEAYALLAEVLSDLHDKKDKS